MPELPDLVHIVKTLGPGIEGRRITHAVVKNPVVLRVLVPGSFQELVTGKIVSSLVRHGPFLKFSLSNNAPVGLNKQRFGADAQRSGEAASRNQIEGDEADLDLVMHLMLAGRLRLAPLGSGSSGGSSTSLPATAFSLELDESMSLHYGDEKSMGKVYLCPAGEFDSIPGYTTQGVDVTKPEFTFEVFSALIAKKRCQARVFIMDQSSLSAIGNAYADEILFEARIHPKAPCYSLGPDRRRALYDAIRSVIAWGIDEVEKAGLPLEDKARAHMRVRGRAGESCPRCGQTIRRTGVLGFDSFFCPSCQPDLTGRGLDWTKLPRK